MMTTFARSWRGVWEYVFNREPREGRVGESVFGKVGEYIATELGSTHVKYRKKEGSKVTIVLLHGLGGSLHLYEEIAEELSKEYSVLSYDFYDRGCSESDRVKYPLNFFGVHPLKFTLNLHCKQLQEVIQQTEAKNLVLVGHSTGGAVALRYAINNEVKGLVLMDAVVLPPKKTFAAKLAEIPILGDLIVMLFGRSSFLDFCRRCVFDIKQSLDHLNLTNIILKKNPRFIAAMASTNRYCEGFTSSLLPDFTLICDRHIPLTLLWGEADFATPYIHCQQLHAVASKAYYCHTANDSASSLLGLEDISTKNLATFKNKNIKYSPTTSSSYYYKMLAFPKMPHNLYFPDAKPKECTRAILELAAQASK